MIDLTGILDEPKAGTAPAAPPRSSTQPSRSPSQSRQRPRGKQPVYFDIETVPDFSREHLFGFDPLPEAKPVVAYGDLMTPEEFVSQTIKEMEQCGEQISPPGEWLDDVIAAERATGKKYRDGVGKLVAKLRESHAAVDQAKAERCKAMSVTPEMLRIVAIGFAVGDDDVWARCTDDESWLLGEFWSAVKDMGPVVGFNVLGFDLPAVFSRSILLGVTPTRRFDTRPWGGDVCDLMYERFPKSKATGLKRLASLYGVEVPEDDCDGSQVLGLWQAGDEGREKIQRYVTSDVEITRTLHRMWSGFFV